MKTIKRKVLVVVFMLGTLLNYANNETNFNETVDAKKVKVEFTNVKKGQLLTVKDDQGNELHTEIVEKEGALIKFFDLSPLNNGLYTIELNKEFLVIIKSIEIKNNEVVTIENSEKVIFKPLIKIEKNLVLVSKTDFDKKPLKIALYYNGDVILSETLKGDLIVKRAYRLDYTIKGDYKIVVYSDGKNYTNEFKI